MGARHDAIASLRVVSSNPALRRLTLAGMVTRLGDWAYATAVSLYAYQEGGVRAVGIFQAVRFIVSAIASPIGATLADRFPPRGFLLSSQLVRACLVGVAAVAVQADAPAMVVYGLAVLAVAAGAPYEPAQLAYFPQLVSRPSELIAVNAVSGNLYGLVWFVGPALGAALVAVTSVPAVFWIDVASFVLAASFLLRTHSDVEAPPATVDDSEERLLGFVGQTMAGFSAVRKDRDLRLVGLLTFALGLAWGSLTVFTVELAIRYLRTDAAGMGYLNGVIGVGALIGGVVVLARAAAERVGQDMIVGMLGWAIPITLIGVIPSAASVVIGLVVIGLMDPWINVGLATIPQRVASQRILARVLAALDSALVVAMAIGAALTPATIHWFGLRWSLVLFGTLAGVVAVTSAAFFRDLDGRMRPPAGLAILEQVSLFAPLDRQVLERLASTATYRTFAADAVVVAQGETSDRFYVIVSGQVRVTQTADGTERLLRIEGPGEFFGEIGLLRDVPRTATVTAVEDTELLGIDREHFLAAISGRMESQVATEDVVTRRLAV